MTWFRRRKPRWQETLASGLLALGAGAASFYLARLFIARERLPERPEARPSLGASDREPGLRGDAAIRSLPPKTDSG